jgi:hypothetical protein
MIHSDTARILCVYALAIALGAGLLITSQTVQNTERRLAELHAETQAAHQEAHLLEVEWHYLSRPERLETLMEGHDDAQ